MQEQTSYGLRGTFVFQPSKRRISHPTRYQLLSVVASATTIRCFATLLPILYSFAFARPIYVDLLKAKLPEGSSFLLKAEITP